MKYIEDDWYVYVEITGAIYGLSQSWHIANQDLQKNLAKYRYNPTKQTPGLWKSQTSQLSSTLVVDNFGIKYKNKDDNDDLFKVIKDKYPLEIDWAGSKYVGINLDWDYDKKEVKLFMKWYVERVLK